MRLLRFVLTLFSLLFLTILFWYGILPGLFLGLLFRGRGRRIVPAIAGLLLVLLSQVIEFPWVPGLLIGSGSEPWMQMIGMVISWVWYGFLVHLGFGIEKAVREGYKSAKQAEL